MKIPLCISVGMLVAAFAQAAQLTLEIPIEFVGHSLTFTHGGVPFQPLWNGFDATGNRLRYQWEAPYDVWLGVLNATSGSSYNTNFQMPYALKKTLLPENLVPQGGSTMYAFAVEEARLNNTMGVVLQTYQWSFPVTKTGVVGYTLSDSSGQTTWNSLGFFNVFADTGMVVGANPQPRLVDLTTNEQSPLDATNLLLSGWEPLSIALPQRNVAIKVPYESSPRFAYTRALHKGSPREHS